MFFGKIYKFSARFLRGWYFFCTFACTEDYVRKERNYTEDFGTNLTNYTNYYPFNPWANYKQPYYYAKSYICHIMLFVVPVVGNQFGSAGLLLGGIQR